MSKDGALVLQGELLAGSAAYIDADWIEPDGPWDVPAVVSSAGAVSWSDDPSTATATDDPRRTVADVLAALAEEAATAARTGPATGRIEVWGRGAIAQLTAAALGVEPSRQRNAPVGDERYAAIVVTTGDPGAITRAATLLADLGTLVVAGETLGRELSLDFYPDVHARGLQIVGVRPLAAALGDAATPARRRQPVDLWAMLAEVQFGTPLPDSAGWFRLSDAADADIVRS